MRFEMSEKEIDVEDVDLDQNEKQNTKGGESARSTEMSKN